jgi:EpsI family protein
VERCDRRSRLLLLLVATALAIETNLVRIFCVIVAGHLTHMQHFLVRVDHYDFGWILFAFSLLLYIFVCSRLPMLRHEDASPTPPSPPASSGRAALALLPVAAGLALGPLWSLAATRTTGDAPVTPPPRLGGWEGPSPSNWAWQPAYPDADERFVESYRNETAGEVMLFRAAYHFQRQGNELRGYGTSVGGPGYTVTSSNDATARVHGTPVHVVVQQLLSDRGQRLLVWSLYGVDGTPDALGLAGRIRYGFRSLADPPTASVIAMAARCRTDCNAARKTVSEFASNALPVLLPGIGPTDGASLH